MKTKKENKNDPLGLGVGSVTPGGVTAENGANLAVGHQQHRPTENGRMYALRKDIRPDPGQPRKEFPAGAMEELRASIEANGIQDAIIVRVDPEGKAKWMLIEGERRWRVAGDLKLERLPIEVREMSEEQVRKYQHIVGTQRLNLSALEQATNAARLLAERQKGNAKFSVAELGAELGLKRSATYELLRLNSLGPVVRKALEEGKIDLSKAQLFGQVHPEQHGLLLRKALERWGDGTISVNRLQETIQREFVRQLSAAPWKWDDAKLVEKAGACAVCPKRSGNIEGFAGNQNICTDVTCFECKLAAFKERTVEEQHAKGQRVFDPERFQKVHHDCEKPGERCWRDSKGRTWGQLAKIAKVEPAMTLDREGKSVTIFTPEDTAQILKGAGIKENSYGRRGPSPAEKKKAQIKNKVDDEMIAVMVAFAEGKAFTLEVWRLVTAATIRTCWSDTTREVIRRRALGFKGYQSGDLLVKSVAEMTEAQCRGILFEILVGRGMRGWSGVETYTKKAVEMLKINRKAVEKRVKAQLEQKQTKGTKGAKKTKGK